MDKINGNYVTTENGKPIFKTYYIIQVDNSKAQSHNINIDSPSFETMAFSECEAIGIMMLSDFEYKYKEITSITKS